MLTAFVVFAVSWLLILLSLLFPSDVGLAGLVLYFCGPLPIIPTALFVVGYVLFLCGR